MMLHRHFEGDRNKSKDTMTKSSDVQPSSGKEPSDSLFTSTDEQEDENKPRRGRPRKV